MIEYRT